MYSQKYFHILPHILILLKYFTSYLQNYFRYNSFPCAIEILLVLVILKFISTPFFSFFFYIASCLHFLYFDSNILSFCSKMLHKIENETGWWSINLLFLTTLRFNYMSSQFTVELSTLILILSQSYFFPFRVKVKQTPQIGSFRRGKYNF